MPALDDKAVIVTGAGSGLGRAFALDLAARGARVVVNDVVASHAQTTADEIAASGGAALAIAGSVADWDLAHELVEQTVRTFGRMDGLVNNAGVIHAALPWNSQERALRQIVEVNLLGHMFCGTAALKQMKQQGHGRILNLTSGSSLGMTELSAYGATKGAITSLTYGWALDTEGLGIDVNALMPLAHTGMTGVRSSTDTRLGTAGMSSNSTADPSAIAPLVSYLMSDLASGISGRVIRHDGHRVMTMATLSGGSATEVTASPSFEELDAILRQKR